MELLFVSAVQILGRISRNNHNPLREWVLSLHSDSLAVAKAPESRFGFRYSVLAFSPDINPPFAPADSPPFIPHACLKTSANRSERPRVFHKLHTASLPKIRSL